ncbi:Sugar transport protein 5, partial [Mucuna pruriens]
MLYKSYDKLELGKAAPSYLSEMARCIQVYHWYKLAWWLHKLRYREAYLGLATLSRPCRDCVAVATGVHGTDGISKGSGTLVLVMGSSPVKPPTGQCIAIGLQFLTIFILSQAFFTMLCHFKFGAFFFNAAWIVVMILFIIFYLPETKGIRLDSIYSIWRKHLFWLRYVQGQVLEHERNTSSGFG